MSDVSDDQQSALSALALNLFPEGSRRRTVARWIKSYLASDGRPDDEEYTQSDDDEDDNKDTGLEPGNRGSACSPAVTHSGDIGVSIIHVPAGKDFVTRDAPPQTPVPVEAGARVDGEADLDSPDLYTYAASVVEAALYTLGARTHAGSWKGHDCNNLDFDFGTFQQTIKSLYNELDNESQTVSFRSAIKEEHKAEMKRLRDGSSRWEIGVYGSVAGERDESRRLELRSSGLETMSHLNGRQLGSLPADWDGV